MNRSRKRKQNGNISEFGAALITLICFVILPLLNLSFIPVRYMLCEGALNELTRRLAHCEKLTEAQDTLKKDNAWKTILDRCGVTISGERLSLLVTTSDGTRGIVLNPGGQLSDEWLPGGANGPCIYSLSVKANFTIAALYQGPFKPVTITITSHSQWENLSKNPKSLNYFINE